MTDLDKPVVLQPREVVRKGLAKVRADGNVPAVVHNFGQDSLHVMASEAEMDKLYKVAGKHHPLNLSVGDQNFLALIKDAHYNPVKRRLQHVVFQAIRQDEKVEAEVPIHLEGEIPAEKVGLMVLRQLDHVVVEALPRDLPDQVIADATKLAEIQDEITVADLIVPAGVTILTEAEHPIARVVETKAMMSEDELAGETVEGEEGVEGEAAEGTEAGDSKSTDGTNPPAGGEVAGTEAPNK